METYWTPCVLQYGLDFDNFCSKQFNNFNFYLLINFCLPIFFEHYMSEVMIKLSVKSKTELCFQ